MRKADFYSHYKSKGQLLLTIVNEYESQYIDQMIREVTEHASDPVGKLHRAISFGADSAVKNLDLCLFLGCMTAELNADVDLLLALKKRMTNTVNSSEISSLRESEMGS